MKRWLVMCLAALCLPVAPMRAWAGDPLALVTDVQGDATLVGGSRLAILQELDGDTRLRLAAGSQVRLVLVADGRQYQLLGPGSFSLGAGGPSAAQGGRLVPAGDLGAAFRGLRLAPGRVAQASVAMRGARPASPRSILSPVSPAGGRVLEHRPVFAWTPVPAARGYTFTLVDAADRVVYEAPTAEPRAALPAGLALEPGQAYAWQVQALYARGREAGAWHALAMADDSLRQRVDQARPAPGADFAERLLYALFLDQEGLGDEARQIWADLARERPEADILRRLAAAR